MKNAEESMNGQTKAEARIALFSRPKQLAFALLIFERMLPSLAAFSKETGFDDSCYLQARDAAWATLKGASIDKSLAESCLRRAPDTEEYSHELTSYALNAALAMNEIVEFTQDGSGSHITRVSSLAGDSLYLYLSSLENSFVSSSEEDSQIASHPLMQEEHRREEADIRFLASLPEQFGGEAILSLRARAETQAPLLTLTP